MKSHVTPCFVSIIIPNFNKESYLFDTLDSISRQSYVYWEAIIVDDCSSDSSVDIIKAAAKNDSRFSLISLSHNSGGSYCRNRGLQKAQGDYIIFVDSDDILSEHCLANRIRAIENGPNKSFHVFPVQSFYHVPGDSGDKSWKLNPNDNHLQAFLAHNIPWHTMSVVWKKSSLFKIEGFNSEYSRLQDVELHTRALLEFRNDYHVYSDLDVDSFYRIDSKRHSESRQIIFQNVLESFLKYICEFSRKVDNRNKKFLLGTYASLVSNLLEECRLDSSSFRLASEAINIICEETNFFNRKIFIIRSVSILYLRLNLVRYIPGSLRLLKYILILIGGINQSSEENIN